MTKKSIKTKSIVAPEIIANKIFIIRSKKVMTDRDLAKLYNVETKVLNQAVSRNIARFPEDFMFPLTKREFMNWKSQNVTSNQDKMGLRKRPRVFTEHGILMLSSVLNSQRAILVNIEIMRTFTRIREMLTSHVELKRKIEGMEKKYDYQFHVVFEAIKRLLDPTEKPKNPIGFHTRPL